MTAPEFLTSRMSLRPPTRADKCNVVALHGDEATNRHNPAGPTSPAKSVEMLEGWIADWQRDGIGYWIARSRSSREFVGVGGLRFTGTQEDGRDVMNLYYRFSPTWWGQGLAGELCAAAITCAQDVGRPILITALIRESNRPSMRVAQRAGLVERDRVMHSWGEQLRFVLPLGDAPAAGSFTSG